MVKPGGAKPESGPHSRRDWEVDQHLLLVPARRAHRRSAPQTVLVPVHQHIHKTPWWSALFTVDVHVQPPVGGGTHPAPTSRRPGLNGQGTTAGGAPAMYTLAGRQQPGMPRAKESRRCSLRREQRAQPAFPVGLAILGRPQPGAGDGMCWIQAAGPMVLHVRECPMTPVAG